MQSFFKHSLSQHHIHNNILLRYMQTKHCFNCVYVQSQGLVPEKKIDPSTFVPITEYKAESMMLRARSELLGRY